MDTQVIISRPGFGEILPNMKLIDKANKAKLNWREKRPGAKKVLVKTG